MSLTATGQKKRNTLEDSQSGHEASSPVDTGVAKYSKAQSRQEMTKVDSEEGRGSTSSPDAETKLKANGKFGVALRELAKTAKLQYVRLPDSFWVPLYPG